MYSDKAYTKKALIPFWVIQICLLFLFILGLAYITMDVAGTFGYTPGVDIFFLVLCLIALILEPLEMMFQSYRVLEPWLYLSFQIYKILFSGAFLIFAAYNYAEVRQGVVMLAVLVVTVIMTLSFLASLIYGAVVLHRHRKDRGYSQVEKSKQDIDE